MTGVQTCALPIYGSLTIKFKGTPTKAASYLANVFIHDGYSTNIRSQSWVISVSPTDSGIPIIKIIEPTESLRVDKGSSFKTSWETTSSIPISRYELYITNNPANEADWSAINTNIPNNTSSYNIDTTNLDPGTYKLITKAIDNNSKEGQDISKEIIVSGNTKTDDRDDSVILNQPQVINMSPSSTDEITNKRVTIKATIVSGEEGTVDDSTIVFRLDEKEYTDEIKLNKISDKEYTIIFQPDEDLEEGVHKAEIYFSDTSGLDITKSWNFSIISENKSSNETITIFGYEIGKNIALIIGIGIITIILAVVADRKSVV